jgi:hypothetical protein
LVLEHPVHRAQVALQLRVVAVAVQLDQHQLQLLNISLNISEYFGISIKGSELSELTIFAIGTTRSECELC